MQNTYLKRFLLALSVLFAFGVLRVQIAGPRVAEAQDKSTVSNYVIGGASTCTSTLSHVSPNSIASRSFQTTNLSASRCYFGGATVTSANGTALCSSFPLCAGTTQAWNVGNVNDMYMIARVGTSVTINYNGQGL